MCVDGRSQKALIAGVPFGVRYEHLYVHVPFCARRCTYCDFSIAVRPSVPAREFAEAIAAEWATRHADSFFELRTLYFGGGTPSKLGADGVARVMSLIRERATLMDSAEVTLEANPEDVTVEAVHAWRRAGINRLSIGVQSFDDRVLKWMHRTHDAQRATDAVRAARDGGIDNVSIDLIFAVPPSVGREWRSDLDMAVALRLPHMSVYGLTVELRTPLGKWVARQEATEAPEESFESEFLAAHDALTGCGLDHYEVSNYGAPGKHSRHNWSYWRRRPYAGLGPSAHEFDGLSRRWNTEAFAAWESLAAAGSSTIEGSEVLSADQSASERVYLDLRTSDGLDATADVFARTAPWVENGWAEVRDGRLRLTALGWLRLDSLSTDLTTLRSRY